MRLDTVGVIARFIANWVLPSFKYISVISILFSVILIAVTSFGTDSFLTYLGLSADSTSSTFSALVLGGALSMLYFYHNSYYKSYTDINFSQEKQIEKIRDLIGRTERSLIIYAGEFNHKVYEDPRIVAELSKLPLGCDIKLYFEELEMDQKCESFLKFCDQRDVLRVRVPRTRQGHFAVADRTHVRLEFSKTEHDSGQYASYHYWRPDFADHVIEKFRENTLANDSEHAINSRLLPQ